MSTVTREREMTRKLKRRKQRVSNGMMLLEREYGPGWEDEIDLDKFDLADGCNCILGQLYGYYLDGKHELGLDTEDAYRHGFTCHGEADWSKMQSTWIKALTPRVERRQPAFRA